MSKIDAAKEIIRGYDGPPVRIMEVCGTHTHEIFRLGLRKLLPEQVHLISGPGCPVCVTPVDFIDEAIWLARHKDVTLCTFGDLVRVPGSTDSLADARAEGARIHVVYSPSDAVKYAIGHPEEEVVFLSVGFETTTPAVCLTLKDARDQNVGNYSLLTANKTMPAAYEAMKDSTDVYLYPGHVHAIMGTSLCEELADRGISGVVAGFTAAELLTAFAVILKKIPEARPFFVNAYPRIVSREGSPSARKLMEEWMEPCDARWRGIGTMAASGMKIRDVHSRYDARVRFQVPAMPGRENPACRCGEVLQGRCTPEECKLFGKVCTPRRPVGACMVSGEGACSAFYQYNR